MAPLRAPLQRGLHALPGQCQSFGTQCSCLARLRTVKFCSAWLTTCSACCTGCWHLAKLHLVSVTGAGRQRCLAATHTGLTSSAGRQVCWLCRSSWHNIDMTPSLWVVAALWTGAQAGPALPLALARHDRPYGGACSSLQNSVQRLAPSSSDFW